MSPDFYANQSMKKTIIIRQATELDLDDILQFEFCNRDWFGQFLPEDELSLETKGHLKQHLSNNLKGLFYLVFSPDGMLIGRFNVQPLSGKSQALEVSYRIAKECNNRGIARYVLKRLLLLWSSYGVEEIYAQVAGHNNASIKVLISCGFQISEIPKNNINFESAMHDSFVFRWSAIGHSSFHLDPPHKG